ncbi:MAG: hypothetical protein R8G34_23535 [Paracoccaceae bacterium]|nr:hypothetical protein [Paracoccaceae bacterium]
MNIHPDLTFSGALSVAELLKHTRVEITQRNADQIDFPLRTGVKVLGKILKPRLKVVGGRPDAG